MRKLAMFGALGAALVLTSSTAFAFDNPGAGYTVNNKTPDFVMQSAKMYGYMNMKEEALHVICHFEANDVSGAIGEKFSTAYFEKVCSDLSVLKVNEASKAAGKLPLLNLENYAKLDASCKDLLGDNFKGLGDILSSVKVVNLAGKKAINMNVFMKKNGEAFGTCLTLTSVNDMLYILASGAPLDEQPAAEGTAPKKAEKKTDAKTDVLDVGIVDVKTLDPKAVAKAKAGHNKFVKLVKLVPPVKGKGTAVAYTDVVSKRTVELPASWSYGQYNIVDKTKPAVLTVAMPANTLSKISEKLAPEIANKGKYAGMNGSDILAKLGEIGLTQVEDIVVTGSMKLNNDQDVVNALANPSATKLQLDVMFQAGLKELQKMGGPYLKLNSYKFANDINKNYGVVTVNADVTALRKIDFLTRVKLVGTAELAMAAWQIHNKTAAIDKNANTLYECWQF